MKLASSSRIAPLVTPRWHRFSHSPPTAPLPCRTRPDTRPGIQSRIGLQRRALHLAPPFLLEDYFPRLLTLTEVEASKKRSRAYAHLSNCNLCPRLCGVNRFETTGMCLIGDTAKVNVIAPHFGEGNNCVACCAIVGRVAVTDTTQNRAFRDTTAVALYFSGEST